MWLTRARRAMQDSRGCRTNWARAGKGGGARPVLDHNASLKGSQGLPDGAAGRLRSRRRAFFRGRGAVLG